MVGDLNGVDQARALIGGDGDAVDQHEDRLAEIEIEQRLRRGEFEYLAILVEAIEATRAQFGEPRFQQVSGRRGQRFRRFSQNPAKTLARFLLHRRRCSGRDQGKQQMNARAFF